MNEHPLKKNLRHIAEEEFPPGSDVWPEIQQAMERANPKRNEMAIRFSNFTRAVAFGAMLVLLTLGLAWVLSNTYAQPAKGTAENTPASELAQLIATSTPIPAPTSTFIPTSSPTSVRTGTPIPVLTVTYVPTLPLPYWTIHIVEEFDTCNNLAGFYQVSVEGIILMNQLDEGCTITVGQKLFIPFATPKPDYQTYRDSGIEKLFSGDLEGGISDLDRAKRIQGWLDVDALNYSEWAKDYLLGVSFWVVDWEQAVFYLISPAYYVPELYDSTGLTAAERYVTALDSYISQLANEQNWCEALRYHQKLEEFDPAKATESVFQTTRTELTDQCLIQKPPLISMDSISETIRQALIDNKANWRTIFVEVMITHIDGNATTLTYGRVWFVTPDKGRGMYDIHNDNLVDRFVFTNNTIQTTFDFNPDAEPRWIETTQILDTLPSPLLSILDPGPAFAMNGTQSSGGNFNPTGTETIAGRETLIVEWSDDTGVLKDRLWIDIFTGVVLKWENLREGYLDTLDGEQYLMDAKVEVLDVLYDEKYWDEMLFNPMLPDEPIYMKYP